MNDLLNFWTIDGAISDWNGDGVPDGIAIRVTGWREAGLPEGLIDFSARLGYETSAMTPDFYQRSQHVLHSIYRLKGNVPLLRQKEFVRQRKRQ
ncbi:hypothetical protein [Geomicrobium sp. JCM 19055]|uniref:hypothetical protein n=1 Tax=Geomicrobium sp. JCM 19055 TaxID=1460649 RepID=UPI00045ECF54|nr:hypothetical protein [Geomicrobium sp. JCM 19055]GAK00616.1 hypothetical protein JCM19055_3714 [Geomicrobium sp. JCM 19055]